MAARDRWIDEGFTVLREQGATGLRVDSIAARLGLTKGSFHHHFRGAADYRAVLLRRYEAMAGETIEQFLAGVADLAPEKAVMSLASAPVLDNRLDAALRSWAADDEAALAVLQRVDRARLAALTGLWEKILPDPDQARIAALVPHLIVIGATAARPAPTEQEMRQVFELLAAMVPSVGDQVG